MLKQILFQIYAIPIYQMVLLIFSTVFIWLILSVMLSRKVFKIFNAALLVLGFFALVYTTLLSRLSNESVVLLTPFITFVNAKANHELYRSIILNIFMFIPFSLGLSGVLPEKSSIVKRIIIVILTGLILSISIEALQYIFSLGNTETDDIIMNTLGSTISAIAWLINHKIYTKKQQKKKN